MTAQVNDTFELDGISYAISALRGGPLFEPQDHGLEPVAPDTSNLRGFHCAPLTDRSQGLLVHSVEHRAWAHRLWLSITVLAAACFL